MLFAQAIDLCRSTPGFEPVAEIIEKFIELANKTELARTLLEDDNRRLRAACEKVQIALSLSVSPAVRERCIEILTAALAPAAAGGEEGERT